MAPTTTDSDPRQIDLIDWLAGIPFREIMSGAFLYSPAYTITPDFRIIHRRNARTDDMRQMIEDIANASHS